MNRQQLSRRPDQRPPAADIGACGLCGRAAAAAAAATVVIEVQWVGRVGTVGSRHIGQAVTARDPVLHTVTVPGDSSRVSGDINRVPGDISPHAG